MKVTHRVITATLGAAALGILFVPAASACGVSAQLQGASATQQLRLDPQNPIESISSASLARDLSGAAIGSGASITLSPGGTIYSGTFAITNYDTNGNKVGTTLTGQVTADRITVDTTTP